MDSSNLDLIHLLRLLPAIGLFLLPGWLLSLCCRSQYPALTTFLGSSAMLLNSILILDTCRIPLHAVSAGLMMLLWSALLAGRAWRSRKTTVTAPSSAKSMSQGMGWLWLLPVLLATLSVVLRSGIDPLSGWDNAFRWDYLARLMLITESLDYYPPVSSHDFLLYSWCDGIPPLISTLNFWIYAGSGSPAAVLTTPRILAEWMLIGVAVFRLSQRLWGTPAGWPALAALASSSLFLWGCAMGQETGLLTFSLVTLVLLLIPACEERDDPAAVWAGIAAGVGAISRDYGLAYILFGGAVMLLRRSGWSRVAFFALAASLVAGPWYLRNWVVTGNPVFPHTLGGLFPTNPIFVESMRPIAAHENVFSGHFDPANIPFRLAILTGPVALLGVAGAFRIGRRSLVCVAGILMVVWLWWTAIPYTAGGWNYGYRVLTPALALLGALCGWTSKLSHPVRYAFVFALTPLALDASRRSWLLPRHLTDAPLPYTLALWRDDRRQLQALRRTGLWDILIAEAKGGGIVVDNPGNHALITSKGGNPVPWFSPKIRNIFSPELSFEEILHDLRQNDIRFITLEGSNQLSTTFYRNYHFLAALTQDHSPTVQVQTLNIYDLDLLKTPP